MLRLHRHDDVLRIETSSRAGRLIGFTASAYLIRGILIDTGIPRARRDVLRFLDESRDAGRAVVGALVTHSHEDHAGNVRALAERGVPVAMADATLAALRAVEPIRPYRRVTWGRMVPLDVPHASLDASPLVLVPTPGHSADHHAVWDPETGTLFGGDLYLGTRVRVAHDEEDPRLLAGSLRRAAALGPARLFDAHRGPVPRPVDALLAKAAWIDETLGRIDRRAAEGWSVRAIAREVLGRETFIGVASAGHYSHAAFVRSAMRVRDA